MELMQCEGVNLVKHCIVCAVGIFCPEHSTICIFSVDEESTLFVYTKAE